MFLLGTLFSFPYILLFYTSWVFASLLRPVVAVSLACVLSNPSAALRKGQLFVSTFTYLLFCKDKKWETPKENPSSFFAKDAKCDKKTIIFVRHGESAWNETFNKGDRALSNFILYFIPNLIKAFAMEWYFWAAGHENESWFYDSPLSEKGRRQAESVQTFLKTNLEYTTPKEARLIRLMLGIPEGKGEKKTGGTSSQIVSSNLRRAIATIGIGFQDRFAQTGESQQDDMLILPALQEISRNPDALSITPPKGKVVPAWTDPKVLQNIYKNHADTRFHTGNKPVDSNGLKRMQEFCRIVFEDIEKEAVIAGGHSLWFRSFFRTYLPYETEHISKKNKLINGGVVGFTLQRIKKGESYHYMIDPTSIVVLHGGF